MRQELESVLPGITLWNHFGTDLELHSRRMFLICLWVIVKKRRKNASKRTSVRSRRNYILLNPFATERHDILPRWQFFDAILVKSGSRPTNLVGSQ